MDNKEKIIAPDIAKDNEKIGSYILGLTDDTLNYYGELIEQLFIKPDKPEPEPETLLSLNGTPILWRGCKAFICGVAKSRKTTALTLLSAILIGRNESKHGFISADNLKVLYVDTEQSRVDSQKILRRVASLATKEINNIPFNVLNLNKLMPEQIKSSIEMALRVRKYDIVILDNWTDCVESVLDDKACTEFSRQLRELAECYDIAILSVIHANESARNDDRPNFRGWGSEEARKSDLTIFLKDMGDYSQATFGRCRGKRPESFCVSHDVNGLPCIYEPTIKDAPNSDRYAEIIARIPTTGIKYTELCNLIMTTKKVSNRTAKRWVDNMKVIAIKENNGLYYPINNVSKTDENLSLF